VLGGVLNAVRLVFGHLRCYAMRYAKASITQPKVPDEQIPGFGNSGKQLGRHQLYPYRI
jgi:hypothetical protein